MAGCAKPDPKLEAEDKEIAKQGSCDSTLATKINPDPQTNEIHG